MSHLKRLCTSSVLLIAASPLQAAPTVASKPNSFSDAVQQHVPSCAQSCLRASLDERFPVACTAQENLECLCSRYSNTGESLGEVAVGCIYSTCQSLDQIGSAYNICLGQKEAVMPTKTAVTTITTVVSSGARTTSSSVRVSTVHITSIPTFSRLPPSLSTQTALVDSVPAFPSATASLVSTSIPAALANDDPPKMTPAQIAGLSVAAVAAFVMAIGLMALSVCLRRRRERRINTTTDEKGGGEKQKKQSARFSHYVAMPETVEPPKRFPLLPPPGRIERGRKHGLDMLSPTSRGAELETVRPVQRLGVGTSNSSSDSSLPLSQIGLAISAELDGRPMNRTDDGKTMRHRPPEDGSHRKTPLRPFSTLTQDTVFEEDDVPARRRSSMLLPTPPVPIPPIRNLQPSRPPPTFAVSARKTGRGSELFLNIPIRHQRPQPRRMDAAEKVSTGSPRIAGSLQRPRLAPAIQMASTSSSLDSKAYTASSRNASNDGDIIDYYFTTHQAHEMAPKASPAQFTRPRDSPKTVQVRSKKSLSTVSRTASRASTNARDSVSSQTSFETSDPNDTTPEDDDDDKQLSDDNKQQLSPVAESPIAGLKYPKVPRASNQLVPRSPRSPPSDKRAGQKQKSPRRPVEPSALLSKRNNALPPLLLESRPRLNSPHRDPFVSPPRKPRAHVRSVSTDSWTATPASKVDRKSKVQSGAWGRSPVMYEVDAVKPLNVRRKRDEMQEVNIGRDVDVDAQGLKSPVWVPRLTPTRKGDDLFISVGWGDGRR
jgi:hypothetical protein